MVVENMEFTTDEISRSNKSGRRSSLGTVRSSKRRMVCGYFSGYQQTDGVQDGKASNFIKENANNEQSTVVLPLRVKRR